MKAQNIELDCLTSISYSDSRQHTPCAQNSSSAARYGMVWYGVYSFNISVHFYIAQITQDAEREMHEVYM